MRFYLGEIYEGDFPTGPRQAVVVDIAEDGRWGKLRFRHRRRTRDALGRIASGGKMAALKRIRVGA